MANPEQKRPAPFEIEEAARQINLLEETDSSLAKQVRHKIAYVIDGEASTETLAYVEARYPNWTMEDLRTLAPLAHISIRPKD